MSDLVRILDIWYVHLQNEADMNPSLANGDELPTMQGQEIPKQVRDDMEDGREKGIGTVFSGNVMDKDGALQRLGGDEELLVELVKLFSENIPQQIDKLGEAIKSADMELARQIAHSVKGAAANVGAVTVQHGALQAESAAREGELEKLQYHYENIKVQMEKVRSLVMLNQETT